MAKSAFHVAYKSIDDQTITATTTIEVGLAVNYAGAQVSTAGEVIRGIAKSNGVFGQSTNIAAIGTVPAKVGAAVAVGDPLTSDAQGRLVPATTGQPIFARALQVAASADQFIEVFITREGKA